MNWPISLESASEPELKYSGAIFFTKNGFYAVVRPAPGELIYTWNQPVMSIGHSGHNHYRHTLGFGTRALPQFGALPAPQCIDSSSYRGLTRLRWANYIEGQNDEAIQYYWR